MLIPSRGKYLCEILSRTRFLEKSNLWLAEKLKEEKKDNVSRCLGVGEATIKDCYLCHDRKLCKYICRKENPSKNCYFCRHQPYCIQRCRDKGKVMPVLAKRGDIVHFKSVFGQKLTYEGKKLIMLTNDDIISIEDNAGNISAVGSMVIVKLVRKNNIGSIILSDGAKVLEGEFYGEVVSRGPDFPDKSLKVGDNITFLRDEGYRVKGFNDRQEYYVVKERWVYGRSA